MPAKWQRFSVEIPEDYGPSERESIAQDVLQFIRDRTQKGLNKNNRAMPGYSKEYIHSVEFRAAGKDAGKVDLTLTGDMLGAMDLISHQKGKLILGFENGTFENAKADGNIRGTYGKSKATKKKRDFLGITKSDLARILDNYTPDTSLDNAETSALAGEAADAIVGRVGGNGE